jgi:transcriptional regulator with AAA-type ATPase domain/tetratricopeptide (TPR) repeat protein
VNFLGEHLGIVALREKVGRLLKDLSSTRRHPPVLIQGETGTGKGLLARSLHSRGPRSAGPFVDVNCAAIPDTLLEAEMFGFVRGAFTGAWSGKPGLLHMANSGLLFLDEVGSLPLPLQAKLLKAVEERVVRRLGATRDEPVDVWIVAATNEDLAVAVHQGRFRKDLYHRLAVLTLPLPPLRERGGDITLLAEHFLARACEEYAVPLKIFSASACSALTVYRWPGNVRELNNAIERAVLLSEAEVITAESLGLPQSASAVPDRSVVDRHTETTSLQDVVGRHLLAVLDRADWNIARAAGLLGVSRTTVYAQGRKHGLWPANAPPPRSRRSPARAPKTSGGVPPAAPEIPRDISAVAPASVRWERRHVALLRVTLTAAQAGDSRSAPGWQFDLLVQKVRTFGGHIHELSPICLVAAFGLEPLEDGAIRAVLAAMTIQRAIERAGEGSEKIPAVELAIHVDDVLIGQSGGDSRISLEDGQAAWAVLNDLRNHGAPNAIMVSEATAPFVERRFEMVRVESVADPPGTSCYLVGRERSGFGLGGHLLTRFVGRQRDVSALLGRVEQAGRGHGNVVGIVGHPGIGKSRLTYELSRHAGLQRWAVLTGRGVSYGGSVPYLPLTEILKRFFDTSDAEPVSRSRGKVVAKLAALHPELHRHVTPLLALLDMAGGDPEWHDLDPPERRSRTQHAVKQLLLRQSQVHPVLLIVEDLHWIDAETQALLDLLVDSLPGMRMLLVVNYRPEYGHRWSTRDYYTQLSLDPLTPESTQELLRHLLGVDDSLQPLIQLLIERTQGNPFFLEECVRTLVETRALIGEWGAYRLAKRVSTIEVPGTVQALLGSRLARLQPEDTRVLQAAAVIGKDVPFGLLAAVVELPEEALRRVIARLQAAEFLKVVESAPESTYTFKHALTHDVAYASVVQPHRGRLHASVVATIERLHAERLGEHIESLAHHAFLAEDWQKAALYLHQVGRRAYVYASYREAVGSLERALMALGHLAESRSQVELEMDVRFDLRNSLLPLGELKPGLDHLHCIEILAARVTDETRLARATAFLTGQYFLMGEQDRAFETGQRALAMAESLEDISLRLQANSPVGQVYLLRGDYRRAVRFFTKNLELLVGTPPQERFGLPQPPSIHSRTNLVWALAETGQFSEGVVRGKEAIQIAESIGQPLGLTVAYSGLGTLYARRGDAEKAIPILERGVELSRASTISLWFPTVASALGSAYLLLGRVADALALLTESFEQAVDMKMAQGHALLVAHLAEARLAAGSLDEATDQATTALTIARAQKEQGAEAWLLRLLGEIALNARPLALDQVAKYCADALVLGRQLEMRPLIARTHLTLGRACRLADDHRRADGHLATASALFREMDMTCWLARAEARDVP